MQGSQSSGPADARSPKAELARLKVKLAETSDEDIRQALKDRIAQLEAEIPPEPEEIPAELPPPATPDQIQAAEKLIVQARVESMRNNKAAASDLMKQAAAVAPGAPAVLEAVADDLVERKQFKEAQRLYKLAVQLDPKNVGLETKFAMCVHRMAAAGSLDDQMRANLSDFSNPDAYVNPAAAMWLSAFLPGLGHAALGKKMGYFIMAAWLGCAFWVFLMYGDLARIVGMAGGSTGSPNMLVLVPLLLMAIIYFGTLASLQGAKRETARKRVERPVPPVDKPFEL